MLFNVTNIHHFNIIKAGFGCVRTNLRIPCNLVYKKNSSNLFLWKRINCLVVIQMWSWHGKLAAKTRTWLREANAKHRYFIFLYGFAICSEHRYVKESRNLVCTWLRDWQRECGCTVATSDLKTCLAAKFVGSRHYTAAFFLQVTHRPRSDSPLHF